MEIRVTHGAWGDCNPADIAVLLSNVASHLTVDLRSPTKGMIIVCPTATTADDPITLYRADPTHPYIVLLQARDTFWAQFSYQFAHEYCHILSGYEGLEDNPNGWFHEALCELAAVFVLRRMANTWLVDPPYPNRSDYATSLDSYASNLLSRKERQLPVGVTLPHWLANEEESLRQDRYQRDKNAVVAYSLLPIFERHPTGWNTIQRLPLSSGLLQEYLRDWYSGVESPDEPFIADIIQILED